MWRTGRAVQCSRKFGWISSPIHRVLFYKPGDFIAGQLPRNLTFDLDEVNVTLLN
jgi:hypothetical protein